MAIGVAGRPDHLKLTAADLEQLAAVEQRGLGQRQVHRVPRGAHPREHRVGLVLLLAHPTLELPGPAGREARSRNLRVHLRHHLHPLPVGPVHVDIAAEGLLQLPGEGGVVGVVVRDEGRFEPPPVGQQRADLLLEQGGALGRGKAGVEHRPAPAGLNQPHVHMPQRRRHRHRKSPNPRGQLGRIKLTSCHALRSFVACGSLVVVRAPTRERQTRLRLAPAPGKKRLVPPEWTTYPQPSATHLRGRSRRS